MATPEFTLQDADVLFSTDIQNREIRLVIEEVWEGERLDRSRLKVIERRWNGTYLAAKDVVRYYEMEMLEKAWDDLHETIARVLRVEFDMKRHSA